MNLEVNKRITKYRREKKITKKAMAKALGINYSTYCRMENEAKRIDPATIKKIAEILGIDPDLIAYGEELDFSPIESEPMILEDSHPDNPFAPVDITPVTVTLTYKCGEFEINHEEKVLVTLFRNFDEDKKQRVRDFINEIK